MKKIPFIVALVFLLLGCASLVPADGLPTPLALELTPTSIPPDRAVTFTPTPPIIVPVPTATPTAHPDRSVFKPEQTERLRQASLKYLAVTDKEAVRIAQSLSFVQGADASNMCGPLAITILKDAGFVPADVDLKPFWLLDPRQPEQRAVIEKVFPAPEYANYRFDQSISSFDFHTFPLKTGDFLYLYAGFNGSFEHMLTVTRVDESGRAYSVTNYITGHVYFSLFSIQELMLYDPTQPGVGQFYEWTDKKNYKLGITGLGGFEVWRRVAPLP